MIRFDWEDPFKNIGAAKTINGVMTNPSDMLCPMCGAHMKLTKLEHSAFGLHELTLRCVGCLTTVITEVEEIYTKAKT